RSGGGFVPRVPYLGFFGVEPLPTRKLARHRGRLQLTALGGRMRSQVPRRGDEDPPPFRSVAPVSKLSGRCLQHLVGVEAGIFTQDGMRQRRKEAVRVVTLRQITGNVPRCRVNRAMPVELLEELIA